MKISYSQISLLHGFEACEGKWFWNYVRGWEKDIFNRHFVIGDVYHQSIGLLHAGESIESVKKKISKIFDKRVNDDEKKGCNISLADRVKLQQDKVAINAMIAAYYKIRKSDLATMKHIKNEFDAIVSFENDSIHIKLDNIIEFKKRWYVHELKTVKTVDPRYVENRKYDFQTAEYFHIYNSLFDKKGKPNSPLVKGMKPLFGVLYDAVQKPGLKGKKGESPRQLLARIEQYYTGPDASNKFYLEDFVPLIPKQDVFDTISNALIRMKEIKRKETFVKSYASCAWCTYCQLCFHGGETKANIALYRKKETK